MNRQKLLLAILVILLGVAIVSSYLRMPRQESVKTLTFRPGSAVITKKPPTPAVSDDMRVRLDLLNRQHPEFNGFKRNIFSAMVEETHANGRRRKVGKLVPPPVPLPAPPPPAPLPQPSPIQRDMAQFTFLGFLKKENRKTIFLTTGNELFVVKKGDAILGKYQVADITDEMLSIRSVENGNGGNIVIPLVENRPLNVSGQ